MGTLTEQTPRKYARHESTKIILNEIDKIKAISLQTGLTVSEVINTCKMLEMRRKNNLYVMNGDAFDEQMAGIGKLFEEFLQYFKIAFAVSPTGHECSALEAIAMTLGHKNSSPIADAIDKIADAIDSASTDIAEAIYT